MDGHVGYEARVDLLHLEIVLVVLGLALGAKAHAQTNGRFPSRLPSATIVSSETDTAQDAQPPEEGVPAAVATSLPTSHSYARHHATTSEPTYSAAVEPTHAMLKLKQDTWALAGPESSSPTVERVHAGKFLDVTGSTHYYLQVKLKSGATGYVPISAVELTRPEDKIMRLSTDAAVLSQPNRYGKRLSEVHKGHDVHVIGVSMNYIKIRMKSGLEGYIPMTATE
jgi:hypothetical protein